MRIAAAVSLTLLCLAAGPTSRPSVDQRIQDLLAPREPAAKPTTQPLATTKPAPPKVGREGMTIDSETGWLGHTSDGHAIFTFTTGNLAPMIVQPNLELDAMEQRQTALGGGPATFRVSGTVSEYKGRAYLLVTSSIDVNVSDIGGRAPARQAGRGLDRSAGAGAVAPDAPPVRLLREGRRLPDATGRLNHSPDGQVATFTFAADGKAMLTPPMILLPNLKLAFMEGQQLGLNKDAKFRVSGTVYEYQGRNYLLLDKAVYAQDFDEEF